MDIAPRQRQAVKAMGLWDNKGCMRIRRKMPATTIVLECNRADTGVGPSIAEASHGWKPNWADLLAAAVMKPNATRGGGDIEKMNGRFNVRACARSQQKASRKPMSPIRL